MVVPFAKTGEVQNAEKERQKEKNCICFRGYQTPTEEVRVHDIYFDNITFMGQKCETWQDLRLVTELANDIYVNGVRTCKQMKF